MHVMQKEYRSIKVEGSRRHCVAYSYQRFSTMLTSNPPSPFLSLTDNIRKQI